MKKSVLKSSLRVWARLLSKDLGISVQFSGMQPCSSEGMIRVFALPDEIDGFVERALIGAIDHEAGHVEPRNGSRLSDPRRKAATKNLVDTYGPIGHIVWNTLEDMRIEQNMYERFPGVYPYFEAVREYLWTASAKDVEDYLKRQGMDTSPPSLQALTGLSYVRFPRLYRKFIVPRSSKEVLALIKHWTPYVEQAVNAKSVWEIFELAKRFLKDLSDLADAPQDSDSGSGGGSWTGEEDESSSEGSGALSDSVAPSSDVGVPNAPDFESDGDEDDSSDAAGDESRYDDSAWSGIGSDEDGDETGSGGNPEDSATDTQFGGSTGSASSGELSGGESSFDIEDSYRDYAEDIPDTDPRTSDLSDAEIQRYLKDVAKNVLDGASEDLPLPDFGSGIIERIHVDVDESSDYRLDDDSVCVCRAGRNTARASKIEQDAKRMFPVIRQQMRRLLLAKRANRHRGEQEFGTIDPGMMYNLSIKNGTRRVFERVQRGREVHTAAILLIDGSGSMSGNKAQTVMRCAYMFADTLSKCGAAVEVTVFDSNSGIRGSVAYTVVKDFDERMASAKSRFVPVARGGTPMAEAMAESVTRLSERVETRKILMILTDGGPNHYNGNAPAFMRRLAGHARDLYKIETFGLGVQAPRSVAECFEEDHWVMLDRGSQRDVEGKFLSMLKKKVLDYV